MFDELDSIIDEQPQNQQSIDFLLSDYYHIVETDDLSDSEMINICKKIKDSRRKRCDENSAAKLMNVYNLNKAKLQYAPKSTRSMFRHEIEKVRKTLHEDYNYRVLTDKDLNDLKHSKTRKGRPRKNILPTKEEITKCVEENMKNTDIARKYKIAPTVVTHLKRQYGFPTRKYNKKG